MKINKYILGKKILLIAGIILFLVPACDHDAFLEETPLDFLSPDNAYLTEQGAQQGATALYERTRHHFYGFTNFAVMNWRTHGSDLGYNGEAPGSGGNYLNDYRDLTPIYRNVAGTWTAGFELIQMANMLIARVKLADPAVFQGGQAGKDKYIAEGRFFRAFAYRYMVSTYGDIPLLPEPVESAKADFTRDPISSIHQLMVEDFEFASQHLPDPGNEDAPGRLTKGPALHYLAETHLEMGNPQAAVTVLNKVIDEFNYALMTERFGTRLAKDIWGGGDPFFDLFGFNNHNLAENTEAMWVIQVEPEIQGGGSIGSAYIIGPRYFDVGLTPDGKTAILGEMFDGRRTGYSDSLGRPTANIRGTNLVFYYVWEGDWDTDIRNAPHNLKRDFYYDNPESAYHNQKIDFSLYDPPRPDPMVDTTKNIFPIHTKFTDPLNYFGQPHRSGGGITHKDWYALRFAETLLLRAEAHLGAGNPGLAAIDVNRVRARANATPVTATEIDIDYILDERVRELFGEEWRLIILRRTGKLIERVQKYNDNPLNPGANIQPHNIRWPIPQSEIDLNVDSEFRQNDGYQ